MNEFLKAVAAEQAAQNPGKPELTPEEKIAAGLQHNEDEAIAGLEAEVENLSQLAKKAKRYRDGDLGSTALEFARSEKNRKVIVGLGAAYWPVRNEVILKYQGHIQSKEGGEFIKRVEAHLKKLDDIFSV